MNHEHKKKILHAYKMDAICLVRACVCVCVNFLLLLLFSQDYFSDANSMQHFHIHVFVSRLMKEKKRKMKKNKKTHRIRQPLNTRNEISFECRCGRLCARPAKHLSYSLSAFSIYAPTSGGYFIFFHRSNAIICMWSKLKRFNACEILLHDREYPHSF